LEHRKIRITPTLLHILLSLSEGPKHGYHMMGEIGERTDGRTTLGPSSLYYSLGRLEDVGLIREVKSPGEEDQPHEDRRRYYALTAEGRQRLRVETQALAGIVDHARAHGLLG
jgi:DNA-binding PadR family transcriptional regulator